MNKEFVVVVNVEPEDFCGLDLSEAISDGIANVGNYDLIDIVGVFERDEYLSTNLKNDNEIDIEKTYKFKVDPSRNGNLNLVDEDGSVVIEFQNNKVE
jgi:hypothetical protein